MQLQMIKLVTYYKTELLFYSFPITNFPVLKQHCHLLSGIRPTLTVSRGRTGQRDMENAA